VVSKPDLVSGPATAAVIVVQPSILRVEVNRLIAGREAIRGLDDVMIRVQLEK
jgi:hypothetical protein